MSEFWCQWAWLPSGIAGGVRVTVHDGRFAEVDCGVVARPEDEVLRGLTVPGLANTHSHAFHRALRGRTGQRGTFWTWRERMYEVAERLDPDGYHRLARAVFAEMALAGYTCVGEFHYLHHPPGGGRYDDPNAMSTALEAAAEEAGIRLTLLDACYLSGGFGAPVEGVQRRYADRDVHDWAARAQRFNPGRHVRKGAALHSVRAVPAEAMPHVVAWAQDRPLHVHLSEQPAENAGCLSAYDCTPTQLLESQGSLGPTTTAVHATHLTSDDIALLGSSETQVCLCPTTEADLADGIGPATALAESGSPLSIGSDGQTVIDPFAEVQALEAHQRLETRERGHFTSADLLAMATRGHRALGWNSAGRIETGARADLVAIDLDGPRTAGAPLETMPTVATAGQVREVIVDGRRIVRDGAHQQIEVAAELRQAVADVLGGDR